MASYDWSSMFSGINDPRSPRNQKHPFISLLGATFLSTLAGIDSFSGISDYVEAHFVHLKKFFDFPNGVPSHDTFQRLIDAIHSDELGTCFSMFVNKLKSAMDGIIAVDGKTIRNGGSLQLHTVHAWCEKDQLVLAQARVKSGDNELTTLPYLLKLLDLDNRIVTIDAIGCQKNIVRQITDQGGNYVIGLKANQRNLLSHAKQLLETRFPEVFWEEKSRTRGRKEQRQCSVAYVENIPEWPSLKALAKVETTKNYKDKTTSETRYYISSIPKASAEEICRTARAHWAIENKLHWRLDVTFNEDKACIRRDNAAENMSTMRKWALNVLSKQKIKGSMKGLQRRMSMSFDIMTSILETAFAQGDL